MRRRGVPDEGQYVKLGATPPRPRYVYRYGAEPREHKLLRRRRKRDRAQKRRATQG